MPLKPGKSKAAFEHNVKAEMHAGKPQGQALAIAYSVKRKPKKMAKGGTVLGAGMTKEAKARDTDESDREYIAQRQAREYGRERGVNRQMPNREQGKSISGSFARGEHRNPGEHEDMNTAKNIHREVLEQSKQIKPKLAEGGRVNSQPKKYPKMAEGILKVRRMGEMDGIDDAEQAKLRKDEKHLMESEKPMMAEGGEVNFRDEERPSIHRKGYDAQVPRSRPTPGSGSPDMNSAERASLSSHVSREYGEGPEEDRDPEMSPIRESYRRPAEDEYMSDHEQMLAYGGYADGGIAEEDPHDDELEDEHDSSIAAAIMAREKRMAEGGEILKHRNRDDVHSHGSMDSDSSGEVDLSRNADEDANEEDQSSYDALRKENYSEEDGLSDLTQSDDSNEHGDDREDAEHDEHDRVGAIMRKMSRKR